MVSVVLTGIQQHGCLGISSPSWQAPHAFVKNPDGQEHMLSIHCALGVLQSEVELHASHKLPAKKSSPAYTILVRRRVELSSYLKDSSHDSIFCVLFMNTVVSSRPTRGNSVFTFNDQLFQNKQQIIRSWCSANIQVDKNIPLTGYIQK